MRALILVMMLLPFAAMSQQATRIGWDAPDSFTDGTPLNQAADLQEYRIYCRLESEDTFGDRPPYVIPVTDGSLEHHTDRQSVLGAFGSYTCAMTAVSLGGMESEYSNEVPLVWSPVPGAPQNLMIVAG